MVVRTSKAVQIVRDAVAAVADDLKFNHAKLREFSEGDDWSFVVKSHALVESAVSKMIVDHLGEPRMAPIVERLSLGDDETGKLAILKKLELMSPDQRRFVRGFSRLRNSLAHKLSNVDFTFEAHVNSLEKQARKAFLDDLCAPFSDAEGREEWRRLAETDQRTTLFVALLMLASHCGLASVNSVTLRKIDSAAFEDTTEEVRELLLAKSSPRKKGRQKRLA